MTMTWQWCCCHLLCNKKKNRRRRRWHCSLLHNKKLQKIRKEEKKQAYFQAPTSATTLKLLLLSRSCYHHVEAPLARALLKLPALEALVDFVLLKLWDTQTLPRSEALTMEVSAKGGGWEGGQQEDERGRWDGRKKGVGASKKNLGSGVGQFFFW